MKQLQIDLTPEEMHSDELLRKAAARQLGKQTDEIAEVRIAKRSIDCRKRTIIYHAVANIFLSGEDIAPKESVASEYKDCHGGKRIVIVGAGPAGLFAALRALELGMKPIIVERGKTVEQRKYDIAKLTREKIVNQDSNWCFGEGGAGTYSDGKLYTRSTKRGNVDEVLKKFVEHGADPDIVLDAHSHIGTDRLSGIIAKMRETITEHGGEYHFGTKVVDLIVRNGKVDGVVTEGGEQIEGRAVILATGHSARDIYELFDRKRWLLQAKPFAIGVRVEHPQLLINEIQYHGNNYSPLLPAATYSLTTQVDRHGVFSFCMCPGGVIVPAATADCQQVVNGMSNSHRNSPYANSGIAVTVSPDDIKAAPDDPLALLRFQQEVELRAFIAAQNAINAPSQRLVDFLRRKSSTTLNKSGYMGSCVVAPLHDILPIFIADSLIQAFKDFDRKMHGFITEEASLMAVESRTSSPVRIPRDNMTLEHLQLAGLYPCGEGAGYAGGIVSSAIDGMRCVEQVSLQK